MPFAAGKTLSHKGGMYMSNSIVDVIVRLDGSKTSADLKKIEKQLQAQGITLKPILDTSVTKKEITNFAKQLQNILGKIDPVYSSIETKDITAALESVIKLTKEAAKEQENLNTGMQKAQAKLQQNAAAAKKVSDTAAPASTAAKDTASIPKQAADAATKEASLFSKEIKKVTDREISSLFTKAAEAAKDMVQTVVDIDTAMTDLQQTTDATDKRYSEFLTSAIGNAKELGRSVTDIINLTTEWSKKGYSLEESEQLANTTSLYSSLTGTDDSTAVSAIETAMQAFDINASDSEVIIDSLAKLGEDYAANTTVLAEGLQQSATSMGNAGTSLYETLAMLAEGAGITGSMDTSAAFLETLSSRMRESTEQITNLTGGKISLTDDSGDFRSYYDIMFDISKIYDSLSESQRQSLSDILFGDNWKKEGTAFIETFQSGQIQEAYEAAAHSAGSAMQQQEQALDSVDAKVQQFETSIQSLANTLIDSGLLKWFVDLGTTGVSVLDNLTQAIGPLGTIAAIGGGILGSKNAGRHKMSCLNRICLR